MPGVPYELIQAAVEAKCVAGPGWGNCQNDLTGHKHPLCVLLAAFAKLPECEAAKVVLDNAVQDAYDRVGSSNTNHVQVILAALAKEFGGQTT